MIQKQISKISAEDIDELLNNQVREDRTTEYKSMLSLDPDSLMKAVSCLANSIGGDLIFGIEAKDGIPTDVPGLDRNGIDKDMLRLMSLSRNALRPPLALKEFDFKEVSLRNGRAILVLRIPQSWAKPHQVRNTGLFYGRSPAGAYVLDVSELKELFEMSERLPERANEFVGEQLKKVIEGRRPVQMSTTVLKPGVAGPYSATKVVFHLVPVSALSGGTRLDIRATVPQLERRLRPLGIYTGDQDMRSRDVSYRLNLDGWVAYEGGRRGQTPSYVQIFRNGILEAAHAPEEENGPRNVVLTDYEAKLSKALPDYVKILSELEIEPPFLLYLSLVNVYGWYLRGEQFRTSEFAFDTGIVTAPAIMVSEPDFDTERALLELLNVIWQAAGDEKSPRDRGGKVEPI
jgi:hypothetical protein